MLTCFLWVNETYRLNASCMLEMQVYRQKISISICLCARLGELHLYNWDLFATCSHKGGTKLIWIDVVALQFHLVQFKFSSRHGLPGPKVGFPVEKPNQRRQILMSIFVNGADASGRKGGRSVFPGTVVQSL